MNGLREMIFLLLMLVVVTKAGFLEYSDKSDNDLCYLCTCNLDGTEVDCSRRGLTDLPNGNGHKVKKLNISNNDISVFPVKISSYYNLVYLDISGNQLHQLSPEALYNLTHLEVLNLSRNNFENWLDLNPNEVLVQALKLKELDLSHNKFDTMGNLANQELFMSPSLETLTLSHCEIQSLHGRSPIIGLKSLKFLNLSFNPLVRIQNLISSSLTSIYVNNCELRTINYNDFNYLPSLTYLDIAHNYRLDLSFNTENILSDSIKYLDISYCNIMEPDLRGFPNLRRAFINHNRIRFLKDNEFINNSRLEYLDLSYNNIGSLTSDTFRGLASLKYLDLSHNEIANMPEDCLQDLPVLSHLKLTRNYLIRTGHLKSLSLTVLDLSYCEINTIGKDSLEGLQSLIDLDLSHNLLSYIPDSISSNTLKYLNLNYNRVSSVNNFTFFMLPHLTALAMIGNRFTTVWSRTYFESNPFLERLDLSDNMWRCDCRDESMYDFYEFLTLEPNKKEESYNLICNSPNNVMGQTWLEACYFTWNPSEKAGNADALLWFIIVMISGLSICIVVVNCVRNAMKRRLAAFQADRERQVEEARDRLRQLRIRAEQEALCNAPDPRDLISPPSYDEALTMPKLTNSSHSLCETGTDKSKRRRSRRKTKSSGDLLDETERNGDRNVETDLTETSDDNRRQRRRRRARKYGSHEIAELEQSPGVRRRRMSEYGIVDEATAIEVAAEVETPLQRNNRRNSIDDDQPRESDF